MIIAFTRRRGSARPTAALVGALLGALGLASLPLVCAGCSSGGDSGSDAGACFPTYAAQFDGFRSWTSFTYEGQAAGDPSSFVVSHVSGPRTEYVSAMPPAGSTAFPVGTIIVKEVGANDPANHHLFTMVKRGCGFNAGGATGWTWMEIVEQPPGATILWQGAEPPAGEAYSADSTSCNTCHTACAKNDFVCSPKVRLGSP